MPLNISVTLIVSLQMQTALLVFEIEVLFKATNLLIDIFIGICLVNY